MSSQHRQPLPQLQGFFLCGPACVGGCQLQISMVWCWWPWYDVWLPDIQWIRTEAVPWRWYHQLPRSWATATWPWHTIFLLGDDVFALRTYDEAILFQGTHQGAADLQLSYISCPTCGGECIRHSRSAISSPPLNDADVARSCPGYGWSMHLSSQFNAQEISSPTECCTW